MKVSEKAVIAYLETLCCRIEEALKVPELWKKVLLCVNCDDENYSGRMKLSAHFSLSCPEICFH